MAEIAARLVNVTAAALKEGRLSVKDCIAEFRWYLPGALSEPVEYKKFAWRLQTRCSERQWPQECYSLAEYCVLSALDSNASFHPVIERLLRHFLKRRLGGALQFVSVVLMLHRLNQAPFFGRSEAAGNWNNGRDSHFTPDFSAVIKALRGASAEEMQLAGCYSDCFLCHFAEDYKKWAVGVIKMRFVEMISMPGGFAFRRAAAEFTRLRG